jgi:hypothetical protein
MTAPLEYFPMLEARAELDALAVTSVECVAYLRSNRIDPSVIVGFAGAHAVAPIFEFDRGRFDFLGGYGDPVSGFICEVFAEDGETSIDLVAWPVDRPGHVLTMFGRAPMLGLWAAFNPATYYLGKPLVMHRTPLDWLRAGCRGAAIVDRGLAGRTFIDLPGPVLGQDRQHCRELVAIARSMVDEKMFVMPAAAAIARAA